MQYSRLLIPLLACTLLAAGCGLKGPLYRPDDKAQEVKRTENSKKLPFPVDDAPDTNAAARRRDATHCGSRPIGHAAAGHLSHE
jgi:predicted small lipoprotein YifL